MTLTNYNHLPTSPCQWRACITTDAFCWILRLVLLLHLHLYLALDTNPDNPLGLLDHDAVTHLLPLEGAGGLHRVQVEEGGQGQDHANYVELNLNMQCYRYRYLSQTFVRDVIDDPYKKH